MIKCQKKLYNPCQKKTGAKSSSLPKKRGKSWFFLVKILEKSGENPENPVENLATHAPVATSWLTSPSLAQIRNVPELEGSLLLRENTEIHGMPIYIYMYVCICICVYIYI